MSEADSERFRSRFLAPRSAIQLLVAHHEVRRATKFLITGGAGFILDFGSLVLLHGGLGVPLPVAVVAAYTFGGIVHYGLTRFWVFPPAERRSETGRVVRYLTLSGFNIAATMVIVLSLTGLGLDYRLAKMISVVTLVIFNYIMTPRFVMSGLKRRSHRAA